MAITSPANWVTAVADKQQAPVYYIDINGHSTKYSTAPVQGLATTVLMEPPRGGGRDMDVLEGSVSVQDMTIVLADKADEITDLVATEAAGAPVASLINRKVTVYAGYRQLDYTDYATIFVGYISGVRMTAGLTGYKLRLASPDYLLDGEIMADATSVKPAEIRGNVCNVYWSILSGTFDTGHATFPLDSVSTATGSSSAPTGLGLASALINASQIEAERDMWHPNDVVELKFNDPENARDHLETEFFRVFQCFPAVSAAGQIGLKFHRPPVPAAAADAVTKTAHLVDVSDWERKFDLHLNKFTYLCEGTKGTDTFDTTLYNTETSDDTTNQTNTGETIEFLAESKWLSNDYSGADIASQLAAWMRIRYLETPAEMDLLLNFTRLTIEQGDSIAVTDDRLPNLLTGARGITAQLLYVVSVAPDFEAGLLKVRVTDAGFRRYGVVASSGQADYGSATDQEKATFVFIGAPTTNLVGGSDTGYRMM